MGSRARPAPALRPHGPPAGRRSRLHPGPARPRGRGGVCADTVLGRLVRSMCIAAGFQPRVAATVNDVGTAISLVGVGWGITIAPEMTPAGTPVPVVRLPIAGVDTIRHSVLIVRDGEHLSP